MIGHQALPIVDTHAHLNHSDYASDLQACTDRARAAGVIGIINVGFDAESSARAVGMADASAGAYAAVGVHPHDASALDDAALARITAWSGEGGVVAIGETGLDFYRDLSPRPAQVRAFRAQLALARELDVPVVLHNRDAHEEMLDILRRDGVPAAGGVMHCFPGDAAIARECVALGLHIGVNGIVSFPNAETLREAARAVALEWILIETDCPYLAPVPKRGKRNEPAYLTHVLAALAEALGLSEEIVAEATTSNAVRLFGLRS